MPRTKRSLLLLFFLLSIAAARSASSAQTEKKVAQKFDEFGDISYSYLIARLDGFAVELMKDPSTKGFLIVYRTQRDLPGLNHSLAMRMKDYLVKTRGLQRERVATVDGGVAEHLTQELWIVPPGTAPTPRSDARIGYVQNPDSAWKFNEYGFLPLEQYKRFGVQRQPETEAEDLEVYANELKKKPNQSACIIVYAQYNSHPGLVDYSGNYEPSREVRLDQPGTARRRLEFEKRYLIRVYGIPASRIRTIDGGYRKHRGVELWIVPTGEPLPIPTPNSFPRSRTK